jgi:ABC-2 type transport system permease protein
MAILIASLIISKTPLQIFNTVKPFLFTTYVDGWRKAFQEPIPWHEINSGVLYLAIYILGFFALSLIIFNRKDILS